MAFFFNFGPLRGGGGRIESMTRADEDTGGKSVSELLVFQVVLGLS